MPIPRDCTDGFCEAYYGRPEGLLNPSARSACSVWSFVDDGVVAGFERESWAPTCDPAGGTPGTALCVPCLSSTAPCAW